MSGFFLPLVLITATLAWAGALHERVPWGLWVPRIGALLWSATFLVGVSGALGGDDVSSRLTRMEQAGSAAGWVAMGTLVAMVGVTVVGFVRPAPSET